MARSQHPADAADAWREAATLVAEHPVSDDQAGLDPAGLDRAGLDLRAWADAAVAAADPERLALVAAREDCDLKTIPSDALRPAIDVVEDAGVRRRLLAALASRKRRRPRRRAVA